jgi:hypothetical protein
LVPEHFSSFGPAVKLARIQTMVVTRITAQTILSRLMTASRELARYKFDLVGVQEVRWEGGGTEPVREYTFFYGKGNENHELGTDFLCIRESYQQLRELSLLVIGCHT